MSKFRKDGALDERYKGAKETNQTGFFGIILDLLFSSFRSNKNLDEAGKKMHQAQANMEKRLKEKMKDPEFAKTNNKYDKLFKK